MYVYSAHTHVYAVDIILYAVNTEIILQFIGMQIFHWRRRRLPESYDASGQVRSSSTHTGLGCRQREGGILPVLSCPLLDQTIVLQLITKNKNLYIIRKCICIAWVYTLRGYTHCVGIHIYLHVWKVNCLYTTASIYLYMHNYGRLCIPHAICKLHVKDEKYMFVPAVTEHY